MARTARCPLSESNAERIAFIKPSALGDIVHALPVLGALRHRFPRSHITWIVNSSYEPLVREHGDLNATLAFPRALGAVPLPRAMRLGADFLGKMRAGRFDLVVDLQGLFRSGFMTIATGAKRRIGLSTAREGARWSYTDVVPVSDRSTIHAVDRYWLVADALGVGHISKRFDVPVNGSARAWARQTLEGLPRPLIMIGAGSRWRTKRWPPSHFAALANDARNLFGGSIVLVGSKDETNLASAVNRLLPTPAVNLTGATTLPQLAAVLALADVMIANDTGPLHLAAALGRPVVAPYTCTTIQRTGPYGDNGHAVETSVWCAGSYQKRCDRLECMAELTPARLWPAVFEVLSKWQERRASA